MTPSSPAGGRLLPRDRRRVFIRAAATLLVLGLGLGSAAAETPDYGVTVKVVKKKELAGLKTYSWGVSHAAIDKTVDRQIVEAIERELTAVGLTKVTQGSGDALVSYHTIVRRDVDSKTETPKDGVPGYLVGVIGIEVRGASSKDVLFNVRVDKPIDVDRSQLGPVLDQAVKAMMSHYPHAAAP
jgi:hypothetical protein